MIYKVKPLHVMVPMVSASVKYYDERNKRIYFSLKIITYLKNTILFGITSVLILKTNLIESVSAKKLFLKKK